MEKRWLFSMFYYIITQSKVVHALPGTDVTLVCSFPRSDHIHVVQVHWSKTDGNHPVAVAVYHPIYGALYFKSHEMSSNFSYALHLRNISFSLSGQYEWNSRIQESFRVS
uniref:CD96 molecule n=1 Tax=Nothoprocta perdicaria TaxID=30464 RepID=A0A8C6Z876_NOTPE